MNVLHWHIVDLESFPFQSKAIPELSDLGAYTKFNHVYSFSEIEEIITFARKRGVRINPDRVEKTIIFNTVCFQMLFTSLRLVFMK